MVRGLYTAAAGMIAKQVQSDVFSHNLANASTPGYRRDEIVLRSFPLMLLARYNDQVSAKSALNPNLPPFVGFVGTGSVVDAVFVSQRTGFWQETGNSLDLALRGNVFFVVQDAQEQVFYTRNGSFLLDEAGRLVTNAGFAVLGELNGQWEEIYVPGGCLEVGKEGSLRGAYNSDGREISRLALVAGPGPVEPEQAWQKIGDSLFQGVLPPGEPQNYEVRQGFREASNVNPVEEMVNLIAVMRAYEANQKVIQAIDSTLEKVVNEVGRV